MSLRQLRLLPLQVLVFLVMLITLPLWGLGLVAYVLFAHDDITAYMGGDHEARV